MQKEQLVRAAEQEVKEIEAQYTSGLVTQGERYNKVVDIWGRTSDQVGKVMMQELSTEPLSTVTARRFLRSPLTALHDG